jgi:hypothetical protein
LHPRSGNDASQFWQRCGSEFSVADELQPSVVAQPAPSDLNRERVQAGPGRNSLHLRVGGVAPVGEAEMKHPHLASSRRQLKAEALDVSARYLFEGLSNSRSLLAGTGLRGSLRRHAATCRLRRYRKGRTRVAGSVHCKPPQPSPFFVLPCQFPSPKTGLTFFRWDGLLSTSARADSQNQSQS